MHYVWRLEAEVESSYTQQVRGDSQSPVRGNLNALAVQPQHGPDRNIIAIPFLEPS